MTKSHKKNIQDIIALTPMQKGMLFHYLKNPESDQYFEQLSLRLSGELILEHFRTAWNFVIETNEMLRAVFRWEKVEHPVQIILKESKFQAKFYDFSREKTRIKKKILEKIKTEDRKVKFNLEEIPFRVILCKMQEYKYEMIISHHHILYDGWSNGIILKEFFEAYYTLLNREVLVRPGKTKFREFVKWIQDQDTREQERFWQNYLRGFDTQTEFSVKQKRKEKKSIKQHRLRFDKNVTEHLEAFVKKYKITLASLLYTTWGILLQRYNNTDDVIFGTTISGRSAKVPGIENIVGLFINTIPLRIHTFSHELIQDLLYRIDNILHVRESFESVSLVKIKEYSEIDHKEELFDSIVVIENYPLDERLKGRSAKLLPLYIHSYSIAEITHYNLMVVIRIFDGIELTCTYNKEVFDDEAVLKLANRLRRVLESIVRNPIEKVSGLEIITEEEKARLLYEFNGTTIDYPRHKTVHELFVRQAETTPDYMALYGEMQVSYRELDEKSGHIASMLKQKGVQPGTIVGVMTGRRLEMVAVILAVLKAGAAYLPIDPGYPEERIRYILADSKVRVLVTAPKLKVKVIAGNEESPGHLRPANLAYIIYTSGSTGKPKGVMVDHLSVVNLLFSLQNQYPFGQKDIYLLKTANVFDVSVTELFGWFLAGGGLGILEQEGEKNPLKILETIEKLGITHINFVPSMFNVFLEELNPGNIGKLSSLKYIFLAGEAIYPALINRFRGFNTAIALENLYGPTEATVYASNYSLSHWHRKVSSNVPIGKPIRNVRLYILDKDNHLQPEGVAGELYSGGIGVARGYLNRPGLTAEKFINYKLQNTKYKQITDYNVRNYRTNALDSTLYRTGDLARWLTDGNIEYLGRIDHQVKIRGFRIELGEIENRLLNHEDIKEAVVIVKESIKKETYLCAFIVSGKSFTTVELRAYLAGELPDYMIPSYFTQLEEIPLTSSGKADRKVMSASEAILGTGREYVSPESNIEQTIAGIWKELLGLDNVGVHDNFFDIGGNSFSMIRLNSRLKEAFKKDISMTELFNYPTVSSLARYFSGAEREKEKGNENEKHVPPKKKKPVEQDPGVRVEIAVIGMSGRFPSAGNIDEFWSNIKNGIETITCLSAEELRQIGVEDSLLENPVFVRAKGRLQDIEYFDSFFFGYTPSETANMDPQIRIFHECCWEALENAGYVPGTYEGDIGLFAGATPNPFWEIMPLRNGTGIDPGTDAQSDSSQWHPDVEQWEALQFSDKDYLSTRIAYKLNLTGPGVTVQTACSTSLTAITLACQGLLSGVCDMALAGGVSVTLHDKPGYFYWEGAIMSPLGHCRTFDARADGTVGGNGAGVAVLKRLTDAVLDGDAIHAVIKGFGINNDGKNKAGFTAPSVAGQARVIEKAHRMAGIEPGNIEYVEAHGTGTILGDPIEVEALKQAFKSNSFNSNKRHYCAIGSVKPNIGHLDAAAGIAGFIKTVLAVKHRLIPPSLHFENPNPGIDFENSPFYVNTELKEWKNHSSPLRAGVSSFGIGGTNAHVVLEEAPQAVSGDSFPVIKENKDDREYKLILLSAKTGSGLDNMTGNLADHFKKNPGINLADAAYTLQTGRQVFPHRRMFVCKDAGEAAEIIASPGPDQLGPVKTFHTSIDNPFMIFMFPGQGAQYVNMGLDLYRTEPVFRQELDGCFEILRPVMGYDIKEVLYPSSTGSGTIAAKKINRTEITQPVIFAFEYALAKLLMQWGIKPRAMIGHSIGEYTAACLSGVFSLEHALKLVAWRGKLMQGMPEGSMLSVPLSEEELKPLIGEKLSLAAVNSTSYCVVSGSSEAVKTLAIRLKESGYNSRLLHTSHAFHSEMMKPVSGVFAEKAGKVKFNEPGIPYMSNVTGEWIRNDEAQDPGYWARQVIAPVRFSDGITQLLKKGNAMFVEVGPGQTLGTFITQHKNKTPGQKVVSLVRHPRAAFPDTYYLMQQIGQLWLYGGTIDWAEFYRRERKHRFRIPLPTYPFEGRYYPLDGNLFKWQSQLAAATPRAAETTETQGKKLDITGWFYVPSWKPSPLAGQRADEEDAHWLVFLNDGAFGLKLTERLTRHCQAVAIVKAGVEYNREGNNKYTINPQRESDYRALFDELRTKNRLPDKVLQLWNVTEKIDEPGEGLIGSECTDHALDLGFYSLIYLVQAMGTQDKKLEIVVLTNRMQVVTGTETAEPLKAVVRGTVQVIPREYPNIGCRSIDIDYPLSVSNNEDEGQAPLNPEKFMENLLNQIETEIEMGSNSPDLYVAYRDNQRWIQTFEQTRLETTGQEPLILKEKGVYLVTGGLGGIGLVLAEYLVKSVNARLILMGRSFFPAREEWEEWLLSHDAADETAVKIRKIREWEAPGAEVLILSADVSNKEQMHQALHRAGERFGKINGVIHAAGIPDGKVIPNRSRDMSETVFAPKIKGTLALDALLCRGSQDELDFMVLCSSVSSILSPVGQVAYCAANAFLDSFASAKAAGHTPHIVSINWDSWQQVGMAVKAAERLSASKTGSNLSSKELKVNHPLFKSCSSDESGQEVFVSILRVDRNWVLDEHRMKGNAVLPGTAYLEMVRAAVENREDNVIPELSDVYFSTPLIIKENEEKEVRTTLKKEGDETVFSITSRVKSGEDQWVEHANGKVRICPEEENQKYGTREIEARFQGQGKEIIYRPEDWTGILKEEGNSDNEEMTFGPRWNCLRRAIVEKNQALGYLELPRTFSGDLDSYKLHPALLDMATVLLKRFQHLKGRYLPFYYKKIKIKKSLPAKLVCLARLSEPAKTQQEVLAYDVSIMNEQGIELVEIQGYTLKKLIPGENRGKLEDKHIHTSRDDEKNFSLGISPPGGFDRLVFRPVPRKQAGEGEVEIAIESTGLNFKEVLLALGALGPVEPGLTFGLECSGRITACGRGVEGYAVGDPVIAMASSCFSPYITIPIKLVAHRPAHLEPAEAATIPVAFMTAYYALITLGKLSRGERVLIHSAAGGVGLAALKIARWKGAEIFATAGNKEKQSYLKSLGIQHVMNSRTLDFADEVMEHTDGQGVNVVLNSLSGEFISKSISLLAPYGRFLEIGIRDMIENTQLGLRPFLKGLSYFSLGLSAQLPEIEAVWQEVMQHFRDGTLTPLPLRNFPIEEVSQAFAYMSSGRHIGKIVVNRKIRELRAAGLTRDSKIPGKKPAESRVDILKDSILPTEGVEVFKRILAWKKWPQVVVSTTNLFNRIKESRASSFISFSREFLETTASIPRYPRPELSTPYVAPGTETEYLLAQIWQQFLGLEQVGIHDDFFELGGDSLKAMTLATKIHKALEVEIPLSEFFSRPNIKKLARYIRETTSKARFYSITAVEKKEYYVSSSAQKRLFFLHQLDKRSVVYNETMAFQLEGNLDGAKVEETFKSLITRHESLRTSFHMVNNQPVQAVHDKVEFEIEYFEIGTGDENNKLQNTNYKQIPNSRLQITNIKEKEVYQSFIRPFDLSRTPLLRVGLIKLSAGKHLLFVDMHHIITDGISIDLILEDFMALYENKKIPGLRIQYKDYAEWQQAERQREAARQQEEYWFKQFQGEIPVLNLPLDFSRPSVRDYEGRTVRFSINEDQAGAIKEYILKEDVTLFMMLLAILYLLLSKLSGQEDIIIGTPTASRPHADLQNIIGFFVNTLALRNYPAGEKSFNVFLNEIKHRIITSFENQDYPFEDIIEKVTLNRDISRNPLFDVMFVLLRAGTSQGQPGELEMPGLKLVPYTLERKTAKFDLKLVVVEKADQLSFSFEYSTNLFKAETIEQYINYFREILVSVLADKEQRLAEIEIITIEEKKQLLYDFNDTGTDFPLTMTLRQLFEEQAGRSPDRIVLVGQKLKNTNHKLQTNDKSKITNYKQKGAPGKEINNSGEMQLSYRELNEKSHGLAGILREKGVKSDTIVGLMAEASLEMIVGMLAILKSHGAYLPIEPTYPRERICYMLKDSGARVLITRGYFSLGGAFNGEELNLSDEQIYRDRGKNKDIRPELSSDTGDVVYMVYTSGSTGKSKGVLIENRNLVNYVTWFSKQAGLTAADQTILTSSFAFDLGYTLVFPPLLAGGALHLAARELYLSPEDLLNYIDTHNISYIKVTPSLFNTMVDTVVDSSGVLRGLRLIVLGGEEINVNDVGRVCGAVKHIRVMNHYGPTETTIGSVAQWIDFDRFREYKKNPTIGSPIYNTYVFILDRYFKLLPTGIPGELCITGEGAARGYLNRPELTAEKFILAAKIQGWCPVDPGDPAGRLMTKLYRTGDLARWRKNGKIVFLGRIDRQVKIRGYRIELGEIESQILRHPGIGEAAVISTGDETGNQRLTAYIVPAGPQGAALAKTQVAAELKEYLSRALPAYMIPAFFIILEKIPLTANGKIDRKMLPVTGIETGQDYIAPGNEIEEKLAALWSEILAVEKNLIGIDSIFFQLGGHSLKATVLALRIHKELNVKVPLAEIFLTPTIRGLAKYIKAAPGEQYSAIQPAEQKEYYMLSSAQKRLFVQQYTQIDNISYNTPLTVMLEGNLKKQRLEDTFKRLIQRHENLRTSFEMTEEQPILKIHQVVSFVVEYFKGKEAELGGYMEDFVQPFDLGKVPLLRVRLVELGDTRNILMVDMHHIVTDGTSRGIMVRELMALYAGEELPILRVQYKEFSEWQDKQKDIQVLKKQKAYWLKEFEEKAAALNLPFDYLPAETPDHEGSTAGFEMDREETKLLNDIAVEEGATLYMVIVAIFNVLLAKECDQEDILIGVPIAGRRHADLQLLIGFFVNMLALRNFPGEEKTFLEFLSEVKEKTLSAYDNQDFQFEDLVDYVWGDRKSNRLSMIDAVFVFQNAEMQAREIPEVEIPGLKLIPYGPRVSFSPFDLILHGYEADEKLVFSFQYKTALFREETIQMFIRNFKEVVSSVIENKTIQLKDIEISDDLLTVKSSTLDEDRGDFDFLEK